MSELEANKPAKRRLTRGQIDLTKRYDVYCMVQDKEIVYENVAFVALRSIEKQEGPIYGGFFEIEGGNGGRCLVKEFNIYLICEHGTQPPARRQQSRPPGPN